MEAQRIQCVNMSSEVVLTNQLIKTFNNRLNRKIGIHYAFPMRICDGDNNRYIPFAGEFNTQPTHLHVMIHSHQSIGIVSFPATYSNT